MPTSIVLRVLATNIDQLLEIGFDQIRVYRSTTGSTGPFAEITTPGTRVPLVPNLTTYTYVDSLGEVGYWYASTFADSSAVVPESSQSQPITGDSEPALDILSVSELKTLYLFGLDLTDDAGNPMPDELFIHYIRSAVSRVEHELDLSLAPKVLQDVNRVDFIRQEYYKYIWIQLEEYPVLSVEKVELVLPTNQSVITFDNSWHQLDHSSGQLMIIPGNGQLSTIVLGQSGAWLPLIYGWQDFIPDVFRVNYTVGFPKKKVPFVLKNLVGMWAAFGPLDIAGDLIVGAGIASKSISMDGLSQSVGTTCLAGSTAVMAAGGLIPIKALAEAGAEYLIHTVDENGSPVVAVGRDARATIEAEVYEVKLSNGKRVECSADHRFMLDDGSFVPASELEGRALMSPGGLEGKSVRVERVRGTGRVEQLYDLTVDGHHCFSLGAGVVAHNSSATNAGYGARLVSYKSQIKEILPMLRRYYKGIRMWVA